ncbi:MULTISPECIES: DUF899 family protein [Bradyrhizobium]|uniref:DUF899 family protein n=1 Tax=Bradyrhizobium TaxID=374 RepID=UPI003221E72A
MKSSRASNGSSRRAHLVREKELTAARERLAEERRALPRVKVDKAHATASRPPAPSHCTRSASCRAGRWWRCRWS